MEATLAAVQFQVRLLSRLVKDILADSPASIIGNVVAASFGFLALLQTKEKFEFVARSARFAQIACRTGQSTGRSTCWILSETAASSTHPILISLELYKNSNNSVLCVSIVALGYPERLPFNVVFTQVQKTNWKKKIRTWGKIVAKKREKKEKKEVAKKVAQSTDRATASPEIIFHKIVTAKWKNVDRVTNILNRLRRPLSRGFRSRSELNKENERVSIAWDRVLKMKIVWQLTSSVEQNSSRRWVAFSLASISAPRTTKDICIKIATKLP